MHVSNKIQEARQQYMGQTGIQVHVLHLASLTGQTHTLLKSAKNVTVRQVAIAISPHVLQMHHQSMHSHLAVATVETNDHQDANEELNRNPQPQQWFLAGATTTCIQRAEAIPGRVFHDFDAVTEASPWDVMQKAGENCASLLCQCLSVCG